MVGTCDRLAANWRIYFHIMGGFLNIFAVQGICAPAFWLKLVAFLLFHFGKKIPNNVERPVWLAERRSCSLCVPVFVCLCSKL